ncbi:hypothetical protein NIES4101_75260 [Calothrix sp. NIES-4101]|nr:hypothetical protein NIES4101_75260 [Calothrix sp. NIES-4101]
MKIEDLNADVIENMYRNLVHYFISKEIKYWLKNHNSLFLSE